MESDETKDLLVRILDLQIGALIPIWYNRDIAIRVLCERVLSLEEKVMELQSQLQSQQEGKT